MTACYEELIYANDAPQEAIGRVEAMYRPPGEIEGEGREADE